MRRRSVTLTENEKLISAAVCTGALVSFIEREQVVIKRVANDLFLSPAQEILVGKSWAVSEIDVLIAKGGNNFMQDVFGTL